MLQFDLQFYEEFTVAWVRTVKFISGAFFLADRSACINLDIHFSTLQGFFQEKVILIQNVSVCLYVPKK